MESLVDSLISHLSLIRTRNRTTCLETWKCLGISQLSGNYWEIDQQSGKCK